MKRNICDCGKMMSKYAHECNACYKVKREKRLAGNRAIFKAGKCPQCNASLKINLALTGWVQCEQFGAIQFRADATKPACSFQMFV